MLFSDEDLKEFQAIYQEDFKEQISEGDARLMATRLIRLYEALAQPLPEKEEQLAGFREGATIDTGDVGAAEAEPSNPPERSFFNKTKLLS